MRFSLVLVVLLAASFSPLASATEAHWKSVFTAPESPLNDAFALFRGKKVLVVSSTHGEQSGQATATFASLLQQHNAALVLDSALLGRSFAGLSDAKIVKSTRNMAVDFRVLLRSISDGKSMLLSVFNAKGELIESWVFKGTGASALPVQKLQPPEETWSDELDDPSVASVEDKADDTKVDDEVDDEMDDPLGAHEEDDLADAIPEENYEGLEAVGEEAEAREKYRSRYLWHGEKRFATKYGGQSRPVIFQGTHKREMDLEALHLVLDDEEVNQAIEDHNFARNTAALITGGVFSGLIPVGIGGCLAISSAHDAGLISASYAWYPLLAGVSAIGAAGVCGTGACWGLFSFEEPRVLEGDEVDKHMKEYNENLKKELGLEDAGGLPGTNTSLLPLESTQKVALEASPVPMHF